MHREAKSKSPDFPSSQGSPESLFLCSTLDPPERLHRQEMTCRSCKYSALCCHRLYNTGWSSAIHSEARSFFYSWNKPAQVAIKQNIPCSHPLHSLGALHPDAHRFPSAILRLWYPASAAILACCQAGHWGTLWSGSFHSALASGAANPDCSAYKWRWFPCEKPERMKRPSLRSGASRLALSAHGWGLPELFRRALEPCWDNCFLCSSSLLFFPDATVGLNFWHNSCCC